MNAAKVVCASVLLVLASGCARARPTLPSGDGTPFPGFESVYAEATGRCRDAQSVGAELRLSGRAGEQRLRGSIAAAFAAPASLRLEGTAFGRPIFYLVARDATGILLLPRDNRVVRNAPPEAIVEALAGVALTPGELRSAVAGCGLGTGTPTNGRMFTNDWSAVDVGGTTTYLRRLDGRWQVAGAVRDPLTLLYSDFAGGIASAIHVRSTVADIRLGVSDLQINTTLDDKVFELNVPPDAMPLTLEELRRAGPLGDRTR